MKWFKLNKCKHDYSKVIGIEYFDTFNCLFYHYRECTKCHKNKKFYGRIKPLNDIRCSVCGLHMVAEYQDKIIHDKYETCYYCPNCGTVATYRAKTKGLMMEDNNGEIHE